MKEEERKGSAKRRRGLPKKKKHDTFSFFSKLAAIVAQNSISGSRTALFSFSALLAFLLDKMYHMPPRAPETRDDEQTSAEVRGDKEERVDGKGMVQ